MYHILKKKNPGKSPDFYDKYPIFLLNNHPVSVDFPMALLIYGVYQ